GVHLELVGARLRTADGGDVDTRVGGAAGLAEQGGHRVGVARERVAELGLVEGDASGARQLDTDPGERRVLAFAGDPGQRAPQLHRQRPYEWIAGQRAARAFLTGGLADGVELVQDTVEPVDDRLDLRHGVVRVLLDRHGDLAFASQTEFDAFHQVGDRVARPF